MPVPRKFGAAFAFAAVALAVLVAAGARASVFARLRGRGSWEGVLRSAGASSAMRRRAVVNGVRGELTVWIVPPEAVDEAASVRDARGDGRALATWIDGPGGGATVFLFSADGGEPAVGHPEWPFEGVCAPGGFALGFSAVFGDGGGSAALCAGTAGMGSEAAGAALAGALRAGGYAELPPGLPGSGMSLWENGGEIAVAWAGAPGGGATQWLLLTRRAEGAQTSLVTRPTTAGWR